MLEFGTPYQLLAATVLSAQTTDVQVNKVTKKLFELAPTPEKMVDLGEDSIKEIIRSIGFYNNKSKNLLRLSQKLIDEFDSKVPETMDALMSLDGVGQKTASVVAANCFGAPVIAVDTHVFRVSKRLGLADESTPEKVQFQLQKAIAKNLRSKAHHLLIFHGRTLCTAAKPKCESCPLTKLCDYYLKK